jgi:hypothetical protein
MAMTRKEAIARLSEIRRQINDIHSLAKDDPVMYKLRQPWARLYRLQEERRQLLESWGLKNA